MALPITPTTVYFGRFDRETTEEAFKTFASKAGSVTTLDFVPRRRFAYVTYATAAESDKALQTLNEAELNGNKVTVAKVRSDEEKANAVAKRDAARAEISAKKAEKRAAAAAAAPKPKKEKEEKDAAPAKVLDDTIMARGLPRDMKGAELREIFSAVGAVAAARMARTNGIVRFNTAEDATKALALDNTEVKGRTINVSLAGPKKKTAKKAAAPKKEAKEAAPAAERKPKPVLQVRVDGFGEGTTVDQLKAHFAASGRIQNAKLSKDGVVGFVLFEEEAAVATATGLTGSTLTGSAITVKGDTRTRLRRSPKVGDAAAAEAGAGKKRSADEEDKPKEEKKEGGRKGKKTETA